MNKGSILFFLVASLVLINAQFYSLSRDLTVSKVEDNGFLTELDSMVTANWIDARNTTGWTYYYAKSKSSDPDWLQLFSIGYMEGYLSHDIIYDYFLNNYPFMESSYLNEVVDFIHNQTDWYTEQCFQNPQDNFWSLVNATFSELKGLYQGYLAGIANEPHKYLTWDQFYLISYMFELSDVQNLFADQPGVQQDQHCSFLMRLTNDSLYCSHTTWTNFVGTQKVYKVLDFNLWNPAVRTQRLSYSSFPGNIPSGDDWYVLDDNKVVTETTLISQNTSVYNWIHYDSVPYWIRIQVANLCFDTQEHWAEIFFTERSGTYNNMWLVIDFNNYNSNKNNLSNASNIIWMVEEFYGFTSQNDVTQALLIPQGYVASYNVPYNQTLQDISDDSTNYTSDPRAILFAKYAPTIQTQAEFQYVMRLNNHSDTGDYCQAIASRCDLQNPDAFPFGACDCKMTSDVLVANQQAYIIDGPTSELTPPFSWADWPQYVNYTNGMPTVYNFSWVFLDPNTNFTLPAGHFLTQELNLIE